MPPERNRGRPKKGERAVRIQGRTVGLTYSRTDDIFGAAIGAHLQSLPNYDSHALFIEKHSDEVRFSDDSEDHFHAIVQFSKKLDTTNIRYFDVDGHHPNILKPRSEIRWYRYIQKDGNRVSGEFRFAITKEDRDEIWRKALESTDREEILQKIAEVEPAAIFKASMNIEHRIKILTKKKIPEYSPRFTEFNTPWELDNWLESEFTKVSTAPRPPPRPTHCHTSVAAASHLSATERLRLSGSEGLPSRSLL